MNEARAHWLERAVRKHLPDAFPPDVHIAPQTAPRKAWELVQQACGLAAEDVARCVSEAFRLPLADLSAAEPKAARFVSADLANRWLVFPLREDYRELAVATYDPTNVEVEQAVAFASGRSVRFEVADPATLEAAVQRCFAPDRLVESLIGGVEMEEDQIRVEFDDEPAELSTEDTESGPVVRLTNLVLGDAISRGASDIHLQPTSSSGMVRLRIDGLLVNYMQLPDVVLSRVISRVKVIGGMDIADRLRPQDGRARISRHGRRYDLRISTVPTRGSEKAVIRVLDTEGAPELESLGFTSDELERFKALLGRREGIILLTGPTGSGKTTTLYAALRELAQEKVNIMTVEDPIEYDLPGVTQIQVNVKQRVTFSTALRAVLRQDPDIILVGEIRDAETAEIAVQAAMTGHVVLATLHANDATGTVRRLVDLGIAPPSVADALRGAVAQRLVRRVCPECAVDVEDGTLTVMEDLFLTRTGVQPTVRAAGCTECGGTGYQGRIPVTEVLTLEGDLPLLVGRGAPSEELREAALRAGMRPLGETGLEVLRRGLTTVEEIDRVLGPEVGPDGGERTPTATFEPASDSSAGSTVSGDTPAADGDRPAPPNPSAGKRALIVDDDATTRVVVRGLLEKAGLQAHELGDGTEAVKLLRRDPVWDLMVLDLDMPLLDGRDVLRVVRSSMTTAALPIIVLTGTPDADAESQVLELGADDYVRKPVDAARLLSRVMATLRRSAVYSGTLP